MSCFKGLFASVLLAISAVAAAQSAIEPATLFTDNMVLQRDRPIPVWGRAKPGMVVTVRLADVEAQTLADDEGAWRLELPALPAGGPHVMTFYGGETLRLKNVLIGDVWVCSGQSNMGWSVQASARPDEEVASADYPQIRLLSVPTVKAWTPQDTVEVDGWRVCTPETVPRFTAVGYFFGRDLHKRLDVPIGLIQSAWGGTIAEAWTSAEGLRAREPVSEDDPPVNRESAPDNPNEPTVLFNAMIHPLIPYAICGVIWYQGESNARAAYDYRTLFPTLIQDWRNQWGQGDFPFLFVQLANFTPRDPEPSESTWAELREAQTMALKLPNTGMAVAIDIGEADDIHPKNKQDVGKRLALAARHVVYGEDVVYSGPTFHKMKRLRRGNQIRLTFRHADGGLIAKEGPLRGFAVAGDDRRFVWAQAEIDGKKEVVVWSDDVADPVAVRYNWANNPDGNLYNEAGLPAVPFRTDDWPGITAPQP